MNTPRKLIVSLSVALFSLVASAFAQTQAAEATVAHINGSVMAQLPDGSTVTVQQGMKLPQGATIRTGENSEAYLVSHDDQMTVVTPSSVVGLEEVSTTTTGGKVTEEKMLLDLKSGNIVAKLNPAKKGVNNYAVRTPKGVAAARGTVFTVSYEGTSYSIAVINGNVEVTPVGAGSTGYAGGVNIKAGNAMLTTDSGAQYIPLSDLKTYGQFAPAYKTYAANLSRLLSVAVATLAVAVENNIGGTTVAELQEVANAVIKASPEAAPEIAALVKASAPSQSSVVDEVIQSVPAARTAVENAPAVTTPQPIDPSTVSRSEG